MSNRKIIDYFYEKSVRSPIALFVCLSLFYLASNAHPLLFYVYDSLISPLILNLFITSILVKYVLFVLVFLLWVFLIFIGTKIFIRKVSFRSIFSAISVGFIPFFLGSWIFSWYWVFSGVHEDIISVFFYIARFLLLIYSLYWISLIFENKLKLDYKKSFLIILFLSIIYISVLVFLNVNTVNYLYHSGFRHMHPFYKQLIFP